MGIEEFPSMGYSLQNFCNFEYKRSHESKTDGWSGDGEQV